MTAPLAIDGSVVVASASGLLYCLDAATGMQLWSGSAGAPIAAPGGHSAQPLTELAAGEGYLVVPAGNLSTGWKLRP